MALVPFSSHQDAGSASEITRSEIFDLSLSSYHIYWGNSVIEFWLFFFFSLKAVFELSHNLAEKSDLIHAMQL